MNKKSIVLIGSICILNIYAAQPEEKTTANGEQDSGLMLRLRKSAGMIFHPRKSSDEKAAQKPSSIPLQDIPKSTLANAPEKPSPRSSPIAIPPASPRSLRNVTQERYSPLMHAKLSPGEHDFILRRLNSDEIEEAESEADFCAAQRELRNMWKEAAAKAARIVAQQNSSDEE